MEKYNITNDFGGTLYVYIGKKTAIELMDMWMESTSVLGGEGTEDCIHCGDQNSRKNLYAARSASSGCIGPHLGRILINLSEHLYDH